MVGLRGHAKKTTKGPFIYYVRKFFTFSDPVCKHNFVLIVSKKCHFQKSSTQFSAYGLYEWSLVEREGFNN